VALHVDAALREAHALGAQALLLLLGTRTRTGGDATTLTHDTLPRHLGGEAFVQRPQGPAHGPRPARNPGELRHLPVGRHAPGRDPAHEPVDRREEAVR